VTNIKQNHLETKKKLMTIAFSSSYIISAFLFICISIVCLVLWEVSNHLNILIWITANAVILILRSLLVKSFLDNSSKSSLLWIENRFKLYTLASATTLSIGAVMLFPQNQPFHQAFLSISVIALASSSVLSFYIFKDLVKYYLLIIMLPFSYTLYSQDTKLHTYLALFTIIFLFVLVIFSKRHYKNIINTIKAKMLAQEMQKKLELSTDYFSTIFKQAPVGLITYDNDLIIKNLNNEFATISGAPYEKLINLDMKKYANQVIRPALDIALKGQKGHYDGKYHTYLSDDDIWINMQTVPMYEIDGSIKGGMAIISDITQRIKAQEKIHHQAFYDHLTGLANRTTFTQNLQHELASLSRHSRFGAVLFIDIDHFKNINDSLGHHIGDNLLKIFSSRIANSIRAEDTVARLGGDEFIILLSSLSNDKLEATEFAHKVSTNLHRVIKKTINLEQHSLHVTMSIGIAIIGAKDDNISDILKHADIAMYEAKTAGRNTSRFFEKEMSIEIEKKLILNNELYDAIQKNQFELYYQPIVELNTFNINSCEALIRWNHPTLGLVFPDDFIPFAEKSQLIVSIGKWVIERACIDHNKHKDKLQNIAINISPKHFMEQDFISTLLETTSKYEVNPNIFKLELTESVAVDNLQTTIEKMNELKSHGFAISMDDFGTGYSSLSYLKNLPFDFLKIDRSFIENILENEGDASLVRTIIAISKQFNFTVIAEGVETQKHIDFLRELNCDYYQGYFKSRPVPVEQFIKLLTKVS
jgi:diguanylate cyclase (GGDEF)-like protein/PAS domain S-box-containing protein